MLPHLQDEADKALAIANDTFERGQLDKAKRFVDKALKLFPTDEVGSKLYPANDILLHSSQGSAERVFAASRAESTSSFHIICRPC